MRWTSMDFNTVVKLSRELHVRSAPVSELSCGEVEDVVEAVYGRICSSSSRDSPPTRLTNDPDRKTVFVFGPDAITSVILRMESYRAITSLGFTKDYIKHELIEKHCPYWLILFKPLEKQKDLFVPATWEGVTCIVRSLYPNVYPDMLEHLPTLKERDFKDFEKEAGFAFLDCRRNIHGTFPNKPPFYNYNFYSNLPRPHTALQLRLFLYCELRLLEMFRGDGYACTVEPGSVHCLEYLCPNIQLLDFDRDCLAVLPITNISIPDD